MQTKLEDKYFIQERIWTSGFTYGIGSHLGNQWNHGKHWKQDLLIVVVLCIDKKVCPAKVKVRKNCGYPGISAKDCEERGCCFESHPPAVPWCFFHVLERQGKWPNITLFFSLNKYSSHSVVVHALLLIFWT